MRKIWFGLLTITTGAAAIAIGCAGEQESTGSGGNGGTGTSSSSRSSASSSASSSSASSSSASSSSASSSSASSSASSSSSSGGGCTKPEECPGIDSECQKRACAMGVCGFAPTPDGTPTASQTVGDCKKNVCDGKGGSNKTINDDTDRPVDGKACTADLCSNGTPSNPTAMKGSVCNEAGGKVCDGADKCVECVGDAQCPGGLCQSNACVASTCTDKIKNGTETDVDCGGPTCNACIDGKVCGANGDCTNKVCTNNVCQAASCTDSTKNGPETDIDCGGGACPPCIDGKACSNGNDCVSKVCAGPPLVCQAPGCTDGVKNGNETDKDCGGSCAAKCGPGKGCGVNTDCTGGSCNQTTNVCDPSCTDGVKNGPETDVDCGGSCAACPIGKVCMVGGDCTTGLCTAGVCESNLVNGCDPNTALDMTGMASVSIAFGGALGIVYNPKCIKVTAGTQVFFNGLFAGHPLSAGVVKGMTLIPAAPGTSPLPTNVGGLGVGTTANFTMSTAGTFPYYCNPHGIYGMNGVIFVVP